ncbi:MAG: metallophosphoesterase [Gammaproteobacteria bacterium]|nr:metallophosphoesterase [Gammaproteobacteria bacterium]
MNSAKSADFAGNTRKTGGSASFQGEEAYSFAHLSDLHLSDPGCVKPGDLLNKRLLGYLSWRSHRRKEHRMEVVDALVRDLENLNPRHIVITGDLTHLGLPEEFAQVSRWLNSLGSPGEVTVIPGNHETYIKTPWAGTLGRWTPYMVSDGAAAPAGGLFPSLRVRGGIAFIGTSSARPSAPFLAVGSLGSTQLHDLKHLLAESGRRGLFRVLLIHHPPLKETLGRRKSLTDSKALRAVLRRQGVELVLHGHAHRPAWGLLKTVAGTTPVVGVPSASAIGLKPGRRAAYNLCRVAPNGQGWDLSVESRGYSPESGEFHRADGDSADAFYHIER